MAAYYNEIDPYAAQWLRNLIAAGHIAPGDVDERSIVDVRPDDVRGYTQCHFFAGIGGWSYALRLAGWPDDRPVWTGSCPCQPFSLAGKQKGFDDERHLWPIWRELIRECNPAIVFGEQVASAAEWLGLVRSDLETMGYTLGCAPVQAASAGADHLRDRYWFVAHSTLSAGPRQRPYSGEILPKQETDGRSRSGNVGDSRGAGLAVGSVAKIQRGNLRLEGAPITTPGVGSLAMADADQSRSGEEWSERSRQQRGPACDWVIGADGKARRVKPGIRLLAHGVPNRVGLLRGFGNAIVPQVAAQFILAATEAIEESQ